MVDIPQRPGIAQSYRPILNILERNFSSAIPWVNPSWYQLVTLVISVGFLFLPSDGMRAAAVAAMMFLDWLDGAAARALKLTSRAGWMLDVTVDRVSEVLMFIVELTNGNWWWFAAALFNIALSHYSVVSGKHRILPLRFFYLVFLVGRMMGWLG